MKSYIKIFFIIFFALAITSCVKQESMIDKVNLTYNGNQNVFPKIVGHAFPYRETTYPDKKLGKFVHYRFIKTPEATAKVFIYPDFLDNSKSLDEAVEKNVLAMMYSIKQKKVTSLTRLKNNIVKKHNDTRIFYNKVTIDNKKNEHVYITKLYNQIVKVRVSSPAGKNIDDMSHLFVGNVIAFLKESMTDKTATTK